jgi:hypothetical protein
MNTLRVACALVGSALGHHIATPAALAQQLPAGASASAEQRLALARQVVDTAFPVAMREKMLLAGAEAGAAQVRQALLANVPQRDHAVILIIDRWTDSFLADGAPILRRHIPLLMNGFAQAYAYQFSEQELRDLLAFASTRSGQAFFSRSSEVMNDPALAAANQAYMQEVFSRLPEAQANLQKQLQTHFEDRR